MRLAADDGGPCRRPHPCDTNRINNAAGSARRLELQTAGGHRSATLDVEIKKGATMGKMAIKIEDFPSLDATAVQVLRVIVLKLGSSQRGRVEYKDIGRSLKLKRDVVAKAVRRLREKKVLAIENEELVLLNVIEVG